MFLFFTFKTKVAIAQGHISKVKVHISEKVAYGSFSTANTDVQVG